MNDETERDLIMRAKQATDIGVSLGAFARSQGMSYKDLAKVLRRHKVRIEKKTRLILPGDFVLAA